MPCTCLISSWCLEQNMVLREIPAVIPEHRASSNHGKLLAMASTKKQSEFFILFQYNIYLQRPMNLLLINFKSHIASWCKKIKMTTSALSNILQTMGDYFLKEWRKLTKEKNVPFYIKKGKK